MSSDVLPIIEFVNALAWPGTVILVFWKFYPHISSFLDRSNKFSFKIGGVDAQLEANQVEKTLSDLLAESLKLTAELDETDRIILRKVMEKRLTVDELSQEVFSVSFKRTNNDEKFEMHDRLRKLRDFQLIKPENGGSWRSDKVPVITRFAELIYRVKPDALTSTAAIR